MMATTKGNPFNLPSSMIHSTNSYYWHEKANSLQDFEEFGIPVPEKYICRPHTQEEIDAKRKHLLALSQQPTCKVELQHSDADQLQRDIAALQQTIRNLELQLR
jgi:hypothetical protein